jgi:hypothetical protein
MDEPTLMQYIDVRIDTLQGELDSRFATMQREMDMLARAHRLDVDSRLASHNELHAREREALADFKSGSEQWRSAANEFRAQLTKERGEYLMRKEIWAMLAATAGAVVALVTLIYFIIYAVHGGRW